MKTLENLIKAFIGESMARNRYTFYAKVAKEAGVFSEKAKYEPIIICLGEKQVIPGLDEQLIDKDFGEYTFEISAEKGFGKKDPKLLQLVPMSVFKKQNIVPQVGLQVNVDNSFGVVRTAGGGRIIVDFNHPLSGKDLVYDIKLNKIVSDKFKGLKIKIIRR